MSEIPSLIAGALSRIRRERPLVHHITNLVTVSDVAQVTRCVGASPVMAHAVEEVAEMVASASALVLNSGTLTPARLESMLQAAQRANELGIPVVLDPVGAGATRWRTENNLRLLEARAMAVVRGNSGELGALSGAGGMVKGIESVEGVLDPVAVAQESARQWGTVVAITGERDILSDGTRVLGIDNGHVWLTRVVGTGCMATAVVGAFSAVMEDKLLAAAAGLACFGLAAEEAAQMARGPASFKAALLDQLYRLSPEAVVRGARIVGLPG